MHRPRPRSHSGGATLVILILVILAAAGGGWWYWWSRKQNQVDYQTLSVTRGDITQAVTATGTLNPVLNVQVGSQISGNIQKLFADYNSPVKEGQVVAQIEPSIYQATVTQAEGDLSNAKAGLELARINAKRAQELGARKAAPQADIDQAKATLLQAESTVKIKEGALQRAKVDLAHCTIYSPVDGIVISRSVDVGQTVAASLSAPVIFTIANDLTKMQIDSNVAEADVGNVQVGQKVDFTVDAFPNRTFHGSVVQVRNAPITVQNVVSYDTVISVNNDDLKLKPGMTANASLIIEHHENVLRIGGAALRFRMPEAAPSPEENKAGASASSPGHSGNGPGGWKHGKGKRAAEQSERTVYVMKGEKPEPVKIKTGISDGIFTEVLEGLNENDLVVTGMTGGAPEQAQTVNPFSSHRRF